MEQWSTFYFLTDWNFKWVTRINKYRLFCEASVRELLKDNQNYQSSYFIQWTCKYMENECKSLAELVFRGTTGTAVDWRM